MFEFLTNLFPSLQATTAQYSSEAIRTQIQAFQQLINRNEAKYKTIRLWVDAGASYGHQSSSVNLMYRLARPATDANLTFGYTGRIELYYQEDEELDKLRDLIPELAGNAPYKVANATIVPIKFNSNSLPAETMAFGMTGGASQSIIYTTQLNVEVFLRLQPFNWQGFEQISFADRSRATVDLLQVAEVGGEAFKRRLYTVDTGSYDSVPWDLYQNPSYPQDKRDKMRIVQYLTSPAVQKDYAVQTVYSIKSMSPRFSQDTAFGASMIVGGALEWQTERTSQTTVPTKLYKKAKPVIIVNFDEFGTSETSAEPDLMKVLTGGFGPNEAGFKLKVTSGTDPDATSNFKRRSAFFATLQADQRLEYLNYPTSLQTVQTAVEALQRATEPRRMVLFVQLGRSFPAGFSHAVFTSGLAPIFEGQNTANLCVNIGRPYLQLPGTNDTDEVRKKIYPSVTLSDYTSQSVPEGLLAISSQVSRSPEIWPASNQEAPPTIIGRFMQQYTDETGDTGTIRRYFLALRTFFANATQDKLALAVAYMTSQLAAPVNGLRVEEDVNPLDDLYAKIKAAVDAGGAIDLVPGVLKFGTIPDFIRSLLKDYGAALTLTRATSFEPAAKPATLTTITLAGPTAAFQPLGIPCDVDIEFTAPGNVLAAAIVFKVPGDWTMPGAPWMVFRDPYIGLTLSDGKNLIAARMGGTYPALESKTPAIVADLAILVGGAENAWPASLKFRDTYPSIAAAYQLLTGYNVIASLPAPFNVLADLGVSDIEVDYDFKAETVGTLTVIAENNTEDLPLFGGLSLHSSKITAIVTQPTGARKLSVGASAKFNVGAVDPAVISVTVAYPDVVLQGSLDSGVLTISKVVETFVPGVDMMLPHEPVIDMFSFMYDRPNDNLAVGMNMTMDGWDFVFPFTSTPLFSLDRVGFAISRNKGINTGNITAETTLLPSSTAPIGVEIGAFYRADKSWLFKAATTTLVDLDALVAEYLGEAWVPSSISFPELKDVSVELVWGEGAGGAGARTFEFKAKTATPWEPIPVLGSQLSATFDLTLGYGPSKPSTALWAPDRRVRQRVPGGTAVLMLPAPPALMATTDGLYGKLLADVTLWNIHLSIEYDFAPEVQKVIVIWTDVGLKAVVETAAKDDPANRITKGDTIATFSLDGESVGSLVEKFVGWATGTEFGLVSPWNILDDIKLSALSVIYNFTTRRVSFAIGIGPIDLGLFTLKGISLAYNSDGNGADEADGNPKNKVAITIDGSFVWDSGDAISWAPDDPNSTPAPPGGGNKYVDLRLLALGQHVEVQGLTQAKSVVDVIDMLEKLNLPEPPEIPLGGDGQPLFAPQSSWFVGMDFGVLKVEKKAPGSRADGGTALVPRGATDAVGAEGDEAEYFISLSVVFNDPKLYALRIALAGPMAKIFAGLDFQIMYQQVSQNVGRYSASIVLPDIMRKLQIGVASITLPTFAIEIYTNGDFQVDIGFPWDEDFSRSFSIELQAGPFPVMGSAGFYFGKLSSATTNKVPGGPNVPGWFNPVIVFGFGAQVGLGKSIEMGILKAGFSLTVFGIIEGVIARWLPYQGPTHEGVPAELQDGYYFSLTGTLGIQGRLYGSVNFAIISADLDIRISIFVRVTFASYEPIPLMVQALVDVSLALKINLGLFKITIHLSFKATVKAEFRIANPMKGPAPWAPTMLSAQSMRMMLSGPDALAARATSKLEALGSVGKPADGPWAPGYTPNWTNLQPGSPLSMTGYMVPALTVVGDAAATPQEQPAAYVLGFYLHDVPPVHTGSEAMLTAALDPSAELVAPHRVASAAHARARGDRRTTADSNSFEDLAVRILQWALAAGLDGPVTPEGVDAVTISDVKLQEMLDYFSNEANPQPIGVAQINAFLTAQSSFDFRLKQDADPDGAVPVVFFPVVPALTMDMPAFNGGTGYSYAFGAANSSSPGFLIALNAYFNQLKVQIEAENPPPAMLASAEADGPSIAEYVFTDYFVMIVRQGLQAMRDGLANFLLPLADWPDATPLALVDEISRHDPYSLAELFAANPTHPLSPAAGSMTIAGMHWQSAGGQSFADIAGLDVFGGVFSGAALALANADDARVIAAGQLIVANGRSHLTQTGDSLSSIAAALDLADAAALIAADPAIVSSATLLEAQSILAIPDFGHKIADGDTLEAVGQRYSLDLTALATPANGGIAGLFAVAADAMTLNVPHLMQYAIGDLIDEMRRSLALQHIGAMMSRYYLHGLRLPTRFDNGGEKLTPAPDVPFAAAGAYPADLGLFALTGQTVPLPPIPDPAGQPEGPYFSFTIAIPDGAADLGWLRLGGATQMVYTLDAAFGNSRYQQLAAVAAAAHAGYLSMDSSPITPLTAAAVAPSQFPLSREIPWQAATGIDLPMQSAPPETPRPRMWSLPSPLINKPNDKGVLPTMQLVLARTDEARGTTVETPVGNYGFGSLISFTIKKLTDTEATGPVARSYEIVGAPESEIVLMERMLDQLTDKPAGFDQVGLFYRPIPTGSEAAGWQSDDPSGTLMAITQTNLSTETRPPSSAAAVRGLRDTPSFPNLIGTPNDFARLLWEASITRQGGFFLTYSTGGDADPKGLPDHIFNDRWEAEVAFFALFNIAGEAGLTLANFMNVAVTNQGFDLSAAALIAKAVAVPVAQARAFVPGTDTLASYAAGYYMGVGVLVAENRDAALAAGTALVVEGGLYQAPPVPPANPDPANPGGVLTLIAEHFGTTVDAIQRVNAGGTTLPSTLAPLTAIRLPRLDLVAGTSPGTASFGAIADYYGAPLATLAATNADASAFAAGPLAATIGPVTLVPTLAEGVAGVTLQRPEPQVPDSVDGAWGTAYLRQSFSLLGYRIAANTGNSYFETSNWGLPAGPIDPDAQSSGDKLQAPSSRAADATWKFSVTVPYAQVLANGDPAASPYLGIGSVLSLDMAWLDIYGNRIQSEFLNPAPPAGAARNQPPQITGYTERLNGVGQWPAVANSYRMTGQPGAPRLEVTLGFDATTFVKASQEAQSSDPDVSEAGKRTLAQAINAYSRIVAQLADPAGIDVAVTCSMVPAECWTIPSGDSASPAGLLKWAGDILAFLKALPTEPPEDPCRAPAAPDPVPAFTSSHDLAGAAICGDQIFKLTAALTLQRRPDLVNGDLRTAPGVTRAATLLAPFTGTLDSAQAAQQRGLELFAAEFAAAFASEDGHGFRIATGSDRNVFAGAGNKPLWVVQIGTVAGTDAISFEVTDPGNPLVYAPRPISNTLRSKAETQILPYSTGTPIDPAGKPELRSFSSIDLDRWMRTALAYIDALLVPKYVTPADILSRNIEAVEPGAPDALEAVLEAKKALAEALKFLMIPVYDGESPDAVQLAGIQEAFNQAMLGSLGQFYAVKAGVQFKADVAAAIKAQPGAQEPPRIYGDIIQRPPPVSSLVDASEPTSERNITVSSPKLELRFAGATAGPSYLSSLVSSTSVEAKRISLTLDYEGQNIEHEIGSLPGIKGYKPSTWLSFVDIDAGVTGAPFEAALGTFDVPIVVRAFPEMPALVSQDSGGAPVSPCYQPRGSATDVGSYNPLAAVTQWSYSFVYSMQIHQQQDEVHGTVSFNRPDPAMMMKAEPLPRDLFDNLAQFVQVYPRVLGDLDAFLAPIDVGTTDPTQLRNAQAALQSAATMIGMLADTAGKPLNADGFTLGRRNIGLDLTAGGNGEPGLPVSFVISEGSKEVVEGEDRIEALEVTLTLPKPLPPRVGTPFVQIEGFSCERQAGGTATQASFLYRKGDDYLTAAAGRTIPARTFVLPDLGIIERQDAQTAVHLTRNADIVPGKTIAEPFVYRTPDISFEAPLHPTIVSDTPINMATILSDGPSQPLRRSLPDQLAALYSALFADSGTASATLQLSLYYSYSINPAVAPVRLPVFLMPPRRIALPDDGVFTATTEPIPAQAAAWEAWFGTHLPSTTEGRLLFDLTVMSDLTAQPMPTLKLTGIYLDYQDIA
ncbi:hypothetical protein DFR52_103818 [Hoeflea marina]|uniref:LysM domain-containing protein n=1 Tax=Hoeflea marina TaxID=274592 RepID=A0A317PKP7_9HYPH|nr:hypothetical protein [Hoeflea marina]PWW00610.1 hypothetical protein DFR52_103818 [Hoeflea marina]